MGELVAGKFSQSVWMLVGCLNLRCHYVVRVIGGLGVILLEFMDVIERNVGTYGIVF